MKLFPRRVGTNYHPQDWSPEQWEKDLNAMKDAGFTVIRTNHICWDSVQPDEECFAFEWLDQVMDMCQARSLQVFLDIPTRSAPLWLHQRYPSINITDAFGNSLPPNTRYMEDVGDPHFQVHALHLTKVIVQRYASHPALLAFGLDNELGAGFHSYSPTALSRFQLWLQDKYQSIEELNQRWNTKRWSRKVQNFSDVFFPVSGDYIKGAPEHWLDMKRFFSDEILGYLQKMRDCCKAHAPHIPLSTNHWAENPREGFDYQQNYRQVMDYAGEGFYPGINPEYEDGFIGTCFITDLRIGELNTPMWCLEFQTGTNGGYACPEGVLRMYAYLAWVYRCDMICAWTWRSMLGGEEQYLFGLLDHDGYRSRKYNEFKRIANEWALLEDRKVQRRDARPRIGIAYSHDSYKVQQYAPHHYKTPYPEQVLTAYKALYHQNLDCNVIDLRSVENEYAIVIVPGHALMSKQCAKTLRDMIWKGTTVIMTAYSAKVDEYGQAFAETAPGYLSEVFGVAVHGFERNITHVPMINEGNMEKKPEIRMRKKVDVLLDQAPLQLKIDYFEYLYPSTAETLGFYEGLPVGQNAAVTCNQYGKGMAVYTGIPPDEILLTALINRFDCSKQFVPAMVPTGIVTRALANDRQIYINTTDHQITVALQRSGVGVLSKKHFEGLIDIAPYDVEIIQ